MSDKKNQEKTNTDDSKSSVSATSNQKKRLNDNGSSEDLSSTNITKKSSELKNDEKKTSTKTFAVIETGGKQYVVSPGSILDFEKIDLESSSSVRFDKVLLISKDSNIEIGQPYLEGATILGTVLEQKRDKKVLVFKFKKKTGYKKTQGHRQYLTTVKKIGRAHV